MDQKRFILAMVLSAGVLFVWQMYFAPEPPEPAASEKQAETSTSAEDGKADSKKKTGDSKETSTPSKSESEETKKEGETDGDGEPTGEKGSAERAEGEEIGEAMLDDSAPNRDVEVETHTLNTGELRVAVTNAGTGRMTSIELLEPEQYANRGDLLGDFPDASNLYPFQIELTDDSIPLPEGTTFEFAEKPSQSASDGSNYETVVYRYTDPDGRFEIDKRFEVAEDDPYTIDMTVVLRNGTEDLIGDSLAVDIYGYKDPNEEASFLDFRPNQLQGVCRMESEVKRSSIADLEEGHEYGGSEVYWASVDTRYFMTTAIPHTDVESCSIERADEEGFLRTRLNYGETNIRPGEKETFEHSLYLGPKDVNILDDVGCSPDETGCSDPHKLSDSIDYGLFAFIARPLRWGLNFLQGYVGNWGLAIILLTIVIKLLTWPINMKAYRSMEGMKEIQPKLEEIRDKYEDDRQRMTEETMKLFRENDVSPMGGCLPMLLQMPILYGLYVMIYSSVELYEAEFIFWYTNLAEPDPFYVLPVVMGVVMFIQQGMMSTAGSNMQAKVMTKVMPFMFTAFMLFLPSGLVLYYSVNLIIGLGQQFYIRGFDFGGSDADSGES